MRFGVARGWLGGTRGISSVARGLHGGYRASNMTIFYVLGKSMFAPLVPRGGWVWGTLPLILGHKWPLGVKRGVWGILPSFQGQN